MLRSPCLPVRKLIILSGITVLLFVVVGVTLWVLTDHGTATPTATTSVATTATPSRIHSPTATTDPALPTLVPPDYVPQGWQQAGPDFTEAIAFGDNATQVAYVCGSTSGTVQSAASHDGGGTWGTTTTIGAGYDCHISINPTNARDVVVVVSNVVRGVACPPQGCLWTAYRSFDSGATWQTVKLPVNDGSVSIDAGMAWTGSTLFFTLNSLTDPAPHSLAASVNGAALAWADPPAALRPAETPNFPVLLGGKDAMYVGFTFPSGNDSCSVPSYANVVQSADGGKTWTARHFTNKGTPVSLVTAGPGGRTLYGSVDSSTILLSTDGGTSWQPTAPVAKGYAICSFVVAQNGTIAALVVLDNGGLPSPRSNESFAIIPAGSTAWQTVSTVTNNLTIAAVSEDATGKPIALWAQGGNLTTAHFLRLLLPR